MSTPPILDRLAELAGIESGWWDFYGVWRVVPAATKRAFLAAMGLPAQDEDEAAASLERLENQPWRRPLEPVMVVEERTGPPAIAVTLPAHSDEGEYVWCLEEELGIPHKGRFRPCELRWGEERLLDGEVLRRRWLDLPALPPPGYHHLTLEDGTGRQFVMALIVTPAMAYQPPQVANPPGLWGIATQIYALKGTNDWGVGTYSALGELAAGAARLGCAAIGINPVHALFPAQPDRFSPYSPSSRHFLNIGYLDVEAIPDFAECREARRMFASPGFQANLARLRGYGLIEYQDQMQLMRPMLETLFRWFAANHLEPEPDARGQAFLDWQEEAGEESRRFALFEALHETMVRQGTGYWRQWPEGLRRPDTPEVAAFTKDNAPKITFFLWLQYQAEEQLAAAHRAGREAGAAIGLYRDLAVGIAGDGAEAWAGQDGLALDMAVGAPPDPLAPLGQNWGLVPFNPLALREAAYAPFIGVMEANMRHAGALRLDHAMSLARLYWVPPGVPADQGAYVRYPAEDLFRLVALESRRNRCLVIGEDLGTVPDGFRERMERMGLFAYRVMVFEKEKGGAYRRPMDLDTQALAILATHDLPSLRGWWAGKDIERREKLELYPQPGQAEEERLARAADRQAMVTALAAQGLLTDRFPTTPALTDDQAVRLAAAAHAYLGRSAARLMMVQMEDAMGLELQMNLPGTTTQHPNWRKRYRADCAEMLADPCLVACAMALKNRTAP